MRKISLILLVWTILVSCSSTDHYTTLEVGTGGIAKIDWTPLLQGGCPGGTLGKAGSSTMAGAGGSNNGGMTAAITLSTSSSSTMAGSAGSSSSSSSTMAGSAGSSSSSSSTTAGNAGSSSSSSSTMAGSVGSSTAGSSGSGIRVLFGATYGEFNDAEIETTVVLENKSGAPLALKDLQVEYFIKIAPTARMVCQCVDSICTASTVGTVRTIYRTANAFISWTFPSFTLQDGRTLSLFIHCSMEDGSAIDESTHYSYPFGFEPGDPMTTTVVVYRGLVVWGILPQ